MITKSAKKANRQNIARRSVNEGRKAAMKKAIKGFKKLVTAGSLDAAKTELSKVYKVLDKTAKAGTIKPNKASRLKSRLTALVSKR